ncbi:Cell division control protein 7 [Microbotryomycetes sp. JL201]|nr:Cell division control protein 7 [Microbotryomycetes sp. JL201]
MSDSVESRAQAALDMSTIRVVPETEDAPTTTRLEADDDDDKNSCEPALDDIHVSNNVEDSPKMLTEQDDCMDDEDEAVEARQQLSEVSAHETWTNLHIEPVPSEIQPLQVELATKDCQHARAHVQPPPTPPPLDADDQDQDTDDDAQHAERLMSDDPRLNRVFHDVNGTSPWKVIRQGKVERLNPVEKENFRQARLEAHRLMTGEEAFVMAHESDDEDGDEEMQDDLVIVDEPDSDFHIDSDDDRSDGEREQILAEMSKLQETMPDVLQRYKLIDKVGEGTFSSVYKAVDSCHDQYDNSAWVSPQTVTNANGTKVYVAVKRIYVTSSPVRIQNELELLKLLRKASHVAHLIDAVRHQDQVLAVMPFSRHQDFRTYYRKASLPLIRSYMYSLLEGLRATHEQMIIHRDVKPANFLFDTTTGVGVLCDYGLAQDVGGDEYYEWKGSCRHSLPGPQWRAKDGRIKAKQWQALAKPGGAPGLLSGLHGVRMPAPVPLYMQWKQLENEWRTLRRKCKKGQATPMEMETLQSMRPSMMPAEWESDLKTQAKERKHFFSNWEPARQGKDALEDGQTAGYLKDDKRFENLSPSVRANRAGTRGFRAPEVLLKCPDQTVALDVWSAGIILLCFLTRRFPFFNSNDDVEALAEIVAIFGARKMEFCAALHNRTFITNVPEYAEPAHPTLASLVKTLNPPIFVENSPDPYGPVPSSNESDAAWFAGSELADCISLLKRCLELDCTRRWTAEELLRHEFFTRKGVKFDVGNGKLQDMPRLLSNDFWEREPAPGEYSFFNATKHASASSAVSFHSSSSSANSASASASAAAAVVVGRGSSATRSASVSDTPAGRSTSASIRQTSPSNSRTSPVRARSASVSSIRGTSPPGTRTVAQPVSSLLHQPQKLHVMITSPISERMDDDDDDKHYNDKYKNEHDALLMTSSPTSPSSIRSMQNGLPLPATNSSPSRDVGGNGAIGKRRPSGSSPSSAAVDCHQRIWTFVASCTHKVTHKRRVALVLLASTMFMSLMVVSFTSDSSSSSGLSSSSRSGPFSRPSELDKSLRQAYRKAKLRPNRYSTLHKKLDKLSDRYVKPTKQEIRQYVGDRPKFLVKDNWTTYGFNNVRYMFEATLNMAQIVGRIPVIPDIIWARDCAGKTETCTKHALEYFEHRKEHLEMGSKIWNEEGQAWKLGIEHFVDLSHLRSTYGPVLTLSEFFTLYDLDESLVEPTGAWNETTYNPEGLRTAVFSRDEFEFEIDFVRTDRPLKDSNYYPLPEVEGLKMSVVQEARGWRHIWSLDKAVAVLTKLGIKLPTDERQLVAAMDKVAQGPLYTFSDDVLMSKALVLPTIDSVQRSRIRSLSSQLGNEPFVSADIVYLPGDLHDQRKPGGLRFSTQEAREGFVKMILESVRAPVKYEKLGEMLADRMSKKVDGRRWLGSHMRRGDFLGISWSPEATYKGHLERTKRALAKGADEMDQREADRLPEPDDPFYLATDETDPRALDYFRSQGAVLLPDLMTPEDAAQLGWESSFTDLLALVEQHVLARSDFFVGSKMSSTTGGIINIRTRLGLPQQSWSFVEGWMDKPSGDPLPQYPPGMEPKDEDEDSATEAGNNQQGQ